MSLSENAQCFPSYSFIPRCYEYTYASGLEQKAVGYFLVDTSVVRRRGFITLLPSEKTSLVLSTYFSHKTLYITLSVSPRETVGNIVTMSELGKVRRDTC